jgi:hypothetical protein
MWESAMPKLKPKQENCCTPIGQIKRYVDCKGCDRKPNKETLEEAAKRLHPEEWDWREREIFIEGAKWQQEQNRWKTVSEETPPSNIELLVQSPEGIVHLSSWREAYDIFSCQAKSESSYNWKWKTI